MVPTASAVAAAAAPVKLQIVRQPTQEALAAIMAVVGVVLAVPVAPRVSLPVVLVVAH
jgi:hypothetical protein